MSAFGRTRMWLRGLLTRGRMERDVQEELAAHIDEAAARFRARGMSERDALAAARREFGQPSWYQQQARDIRGGRWLRDAARDVSYALRYFARTPLTTLTIILTLALGIGFSSAVFSTLHGILYRPAPGVPDEADLVKIRGLTNRAPFTRRVSWPEILAYRGLTDHFSAVAAWVSSSVVLEAPGGTDRGTSSAAQFVTPNYFSTLGLRVARGRVFEIAPTAGVAELSAILSHELAEVRFGEAESAVGQQIVVNGVTMTIVGVTPPKFHGALPAGDFRVVWLPMSAWPEIEKVAAGLFTDPDARRFEAFARLLPGLTPGEATPAVEVVAARVDADARAIVSRTWTGSADVVRLRGDELNGKYDKDLPIGALIGTIIALLVLAVCTTTVNSLLVGASATRRHEIGVRLALGASRARVVRQLLTESALLATAAGLLGMWLFGAALRVSEVARDGIDVSPEWTTSGFVLLYALATAVLAGLSPALHATRAGVSDVLKDSQGGSRRSRLQRTFVVAQIAVAQPLMVALAVVIVSFVGNIPGEAPEVRQRLAQLQLDVHASSARGEPDPIPALMRRLNETPGIAAVVPLGWATGPMRLEALTADTSARAILAMEHFVPPGYFAAVDALFIQGRDFVYADTLPAVTPVVLSEALAAALFPAGGAVGGQFTMRQRGIDESARMQVIGVVSSARGADAQRSDNEWPPMYAPLKRRGDAFLMIRTEGPAEPLLPTIMAAARREARMMPVTSLQTMAQEDRADRERDVQIAGALMGMGLVALLLASVGLYAMVRMAVEQRRREIGVRVALGADVGRVVRMFFAGGLKTTALGLAIGLPLSIAGLAAIKNIIGDFTGLLPAGLGVTLTVLAVASLASWLPARRAARVDAMIALRSE